MARQLVTNDVDVARMVAMAAATWFCQQW